MGLPIQQVLEILEDYRVGMRDPSIASVVSRMGLGRCDLPVGGNAPGRLLFYFDVAVALSKLTRNEHELVWLYHLINRARDKAEREWKHHEAEAFRRDLYNIRNRKAFRSGIDKLCDRLATVRMASA